MTTKRKKLRTQDETDAPDVARSSVRCRKLAPPPPPFEPTLSKEELTDGIAADAVLRATGRGGAGGLFGNREFRIGRAAELSFTPMDQPDLRVTVQGSRVTLNEEVRMPAPSREVLDTLINPSRRARPSVGFDPAAEGGDFTATMTLQNVNTAALRAFAGLPPGDELAATMGQLRTALQNEVSNRINISTPQSRDTDFVEAVRRAMSPGRLNLQEVSLESDFSDESWDSVMNYGGLPSMPHQQTAEQVHAANEESNRNGVRLRSEVTSILYSGQSRQRTPIRSDRIVVTERQAITPYTRNEPPSLTARTSQVESLEVSIRADHPAHLGHAIVDVFLELLERSGGWRRAAGRLVDAPVMGARVVMHTEVSLAVAQTAGNHDSIVVTLLDSTGERVFVYDTRMRSEAQFGRRSSRERVSGAIDEACDEFAGRIRRR